jgi:hypothetical protein
VEDFQSILEGTLAFLEEGGGSAQMFLRGSYFLANLYVLAGQPDEAFGYLETALSERHPSFAVSVMGVPSLDPIRDDPRFRALLQRVGLVD